MRNHNILPRWVQASLGALLILLALAAGTATLLVNVAYGAQESQFKAFIFGLADGMKILIPLTAACYGWSRFLGWAWLTALAFSIYAALSFYMATSGQTLLNAGKQDEIRAAAADSLAEAQAALARITETGSVAALAALIRSAEASIESEAEVAHKSGIKPTERKLYRNAVAARDKYTARLAEAEHRDALEAKRTAAKAELATARPQALGMADNLAALTGADRAIIARLDSIVSAVIAILLAEMATYLTVYGVPLLIGDRPRPKQPEASAELVPAAASDSSAALFRLRLLIVNSGGSLTRGRRELADELGAKRSTLQDWIGKWTAAGMIATEIGPDGRTVFTFPPERSAA